LKLILSIFLLNDDLIYLTQKSHIVENKIFKIGNFVNLGYQKKSAYTKKLIEIDFVFSRIFTHLGNLQMARSIGSISIHPSPT